MARKLERQGRKPIKRPKVRSWETTDEQEVELRAERARNEAMSIRKLDEGSWVFGLYEVRRKDGDEVTFPYLVELRCLQERINTCNCPDFKKSGLGTCKHVERVILKAPKKLSRKALPVSEVFVKYVDGRRRPCIRLSKQATPSARRFANTYIDASGLFRRPFEATLSVFLRDLEVASNSLQEAFRVSSEIRGWSKDHDRQLEASAAQKNFEAHYDNETYLRHPLYDYQQEGMKHLAYKGRAMLTDEMGLGKTVQAVAAAKVLQDMHGIKRVLIVCPASLKTEWEEQIRKFTSLPTELVYGSRKDRLGLYANSKAFFLVSNYEQIIRDFEDINELLQPDLVILDEAQRIKNWKTKTAQSIKRLQSRFAFVLTGTPLENRIDEVYSLTEFVDETLFGSLFRFNREFYTFDEKGKVAALQNLRQLNERLKPVMLRRRKDEIEEQLPERIDNNYFVPMTKEQQNRYAEYEYQVSIIASIAKKRPLRPEEFERLQLHLACMRMLCDTVYILDQSIKECPKVEELDRILNDVWSNEPDRKVIVFSEWVKMLELVRDMLDESGIDSCLHIGSVPQKKRREEINRFKKDPNCRVFLSSDSGSVGLNLQDASVVINLDLPWNPAKLEQRIARAWRKHQRNVVNVINLVAEGTIEHRMLSTLSFKQGLADAVLDARGNFDEFEKENARAAFMEKLSKVLGADFASQSPSESEQSASKPAPAELFKEDIVAKDDPGLAVCGISRDANSRDVTSVFAVATDPDKAKATIAASLERSRNATETEATVLSLEQFKLLQELAEKGIISLNDTMLEDVIRRDVAMPTRKDTRQERATEAEALLKSVERQAGMAELLKSGGFVEEAILPAKSVAEAALKALYVVANDDALPMTTDNLSDAMLSAIRKNGWLTDDHWSAVEGRADVSEETCRLLLELPDLAESQRLQLLL